MMRKSFNVAGFIGTAVIGMSLIMTAPQGAPAQTVGADGDTVEWFDANPLIGQPQTRLFDFSGADITLTDGLIFQIVVDPNRDTDFSGILAAGNSGMGWGVAAEDHMYSGSTVDYNAQDDVVMAQGNWQSDGATLGVLLQQATILSDANGAYMNSDFYFRWFNSSSTDPGSAEAGIIFREAGLWRTRSDPETVPEMHSANLAYSVTANDGSQIVGDGWQSMPMVPEPGTFALFGLGLLTVAARRKLRKTA